MSEPEFPPKLVERIALAAERHMFADYELPISDKWLHANYCDLAIYLLRESGRNELVEALILARRSLDPIEDCVACYQIDATLRKTGVIAKAEGKG